MTLRSRVADSTILKNNHDVSTDTFWSLLLVYDHHREGYVI
jgi:hypothetical protein